tara:strand:+ start:12 stop:665 length:654 start_codon:yes stop_codon:yes gene_type:complete
MFSLNLYTQKIYGLIFTLLVFIIIITGSTPVPAAQQRLMVFGDSLVAGYGLSAGEGFPEQLQQALTAAGKNVKVLNAGVSGDTSAGGLARLDWALSDRPDAVIIVLGGNDMLRGLDPQQTRQNLVRILTRLRQVDIKILLCGMLAPMNLGPVYRQQFDSIYPELADRFNTGFYPFFLDGVALNPEFNQLDGLHPNKAGVAVITKSVLPAVLSVLDKD